MPLLQMNSVLGSVGTDAALSCPPSFLSFHCSFRLSSHACLCKKPPVISVYSYSSECAQISFTNNFEAKVRPSCWSSSNGNLVVQYVLRNSSVLHADYMAKPAQPYLNEQGQHARCPTCARTSLFGTRSCQVMPKIPLRQRRWKVLNQRSWQE